MTEEEVRQAEKTYPSVKLAYPIAVASYDVALKRLDAMDGRLQTIITFIVASSAVVPSVAAGRVHFRSGWFYAALGCFVLAIVVGTIARLKGRIKVLVPRRAFNHWLHKPEWEFQNDFIAFAADDFEENNTLVLFKWKCTIALSVLFLCQAACLVVWVVGSS